MQRHNIKFLAATLLVVASGALAIGVRAERSHSEYPNWVSDDGGILLDKIPDTIHLATDKYKEGYALLDSQAFKTREIDGPYNVYAPDDVDMKTAVFWYYHGVGIVPIGTTLLEAKANNPTPPTTAGPEIVPVTNASVPAKVDVAVPGTGS